MISKKIKRKTILIVLSVIALTLLTMNVSYAYIFSVKSQSTVETFTAGTLSVSINSSTKMQSTQLLPSSEGFPTGPKSGIKDDNNYSYATLSLSNTGTLNADFTASVSVDTDNLPNGKTASDCVDLRYVIIGIYDEAKKEWRNLGTDSSPSYTSPIASFESSNGVYPILTGTIAGKTSNNYRIYVWLSEGTPTSEIGKYLYLKMSVNSCVEGQQCR